MSLVEIPDPPGYKVVAYRKPKKGEQHLRNTGAVYTANIDFDCSSHPIVEPVVVWRDATVADLERAPVKCRTQNEVDGPLVDKILLRYAADMKPYVWGTNDGMFHTTVQVVDESSPAK